MWPGEAEILGVGFPKKIPGFNGLTTINETSDWVETLQVSTKGSVKDEDWLDAPMMSLCDQSRDI